MFNSFYKQNYYRMHKVSIITRQGCEALPTEHTSDLQNYMKGKDQLILISWIQKWYYIHLWYIVLPTLLSTKKCIWWFTRPRLKRSPFWPLWVSKQEQRHIRDATWDYVVTSTPAYLPAVISLKRPTHPALLTLRHWSPPPLAHNYLCTAAEKATVSQTRKSAQEWLYSIRLGWNQFFFFSHRSLHGAAF